MKKVNRISRVLLLTGLLFLFPLVQSFAQENSTRNAAEPFNLSVKFEKIGWHDFFVLYNEPNQLYLPVSQVFEFLRINSKLSNNGKVLEGYFIDPKNPYKIDFDTRNINYKSITTTLAPNDALYDLGTMYLSPTVLESVFGFKTKFDFRTLSANISTDYELPISKLLKLEDARKNIKNLTGDEKFDATYPRKYHLFKPGMLDWSISSNQSAVYTNETRAGFALGAEVFGGELSTWLYYSDKYGFNRNQQRYHWRWVDNNVKLVKQLQFGRIYNRNIATMLYPVDGFMVTNAPTTVRKALGTFQIAQNTNPDWTVELYINNVLIDYTKADASGYFAFQVPIVYGTTDVTLRFYGPNGEEQAERKTYNMPYNMLPKGEFEYRVSGGTLLDGNNSLYARAETNLGISKWLTAGAGYEFLNSIAGNPHIPFGNFTLQPFSRLILTGEYAHKVRYKGTLNYNFANNSLFEMYYARYDKNQKAIIYNFLEERMAGFTFPTRLKNVSAVTKATFRQNIYPNFEYNAGDLMLSAYYRNFNANLSNFINWTTFDNRNIYSNLSLGFRFGNGFSFRPSVMYSYTENKPNWYDNFISYRAELEKQIFKKGYVTLGYEKNNLVNFQSVNVAFRYDFSFMSTYAAAYYNNGSLQTTQSARGSLAFGSGANYVHFDSREAVGRSGISIIPFVDKNFNGVRDANEPAASDLNVKCNGGKILYRKNDSIVRVVSLDPFVDYALTVNESDFKNIAWKVSNHTIKVTTDPNQFKTIQVPVQPLGEMSGVVVDESNNGVSRILVNIFNSKAKLEKTLLTESDGFFSYLGLKPGQYYAVVDSAQLKVLNMSADPSPFRIKEDVNGDIVETGTIKLKQNIVPQIITELAQTATPQAQVNPVQAQNVEASTQKSTEPNPKTTVQTKKVLEEPIKATAQTPLTDLNQKRADSKVDMSNSKSREDSVSTLSKLNVYTNKNNNDPDRIHKYDSLIHYVIKLDLNSSTVHSEFYGTIKQLGKLLKENENLKLEMFGNPASFNNDKANVLFSEHRANSVKRMLVKYGIAADRIRVLSFKQQATVPVNTSKKRIQNDQSRRIVFKSASDKQMAKVDSIGRKAPEDITNSDIRTLKKSFNYVDEFDPFEVKWRYVYSVLFRYGSAHIQPENRIVVNALAGVMRNNPCLKVNLESHSDPESSDKFNMELSLRRSQTVWNALVFNGVDQERIETSNYGEIKPLNKNRNEAEKALNRRVTFKVQPTGCQLNLDSLITKEILRTYNTRISNQIIINHDGQYMIQTGLFKTEELAIMMAIKLKDLLPDNIYIVKDQGLFRVIVGYTKTRKEAVDIARIIQASGILANPYNY